MSAPILSPAYLKNFTKNANISHRQIHDLKSKYSYLYWVWNKSKASLWSFEINTYSL